MKTNLHHSPAVQNQKNERKNVMKKTRYCLGFECRCYHVSCSQQRCSEASQRVSGRHTLMESVTRDSPAAVQVSAYIEATLCFVFLGEGTHI